MSPKSILLSPFSKQCIFASLVKIHPLVQKIAHGNNILDISKCSCDLENTVTFVRSPKSNQLFPTFKQSISASLVKIHPLAQKITHGNHILDISKCLCDPENKVKVTKSNQLFPSSQQCLHACLVKIHQLVQKIMHRNEKVDDDANADTDADEIRTNNNIRVHGT